MEIKDLHWIKANKTSEYLLPTLEFDSKELTLQYFLDFGMINAYCGIDDYHRFDPYCLYLLFNTSRERLERWYEFYKIYSREKLYSFDEDLAYGTILIGFRIPHKYKNFPKYLIQGKYSKMCTGYEKKFLVPVEGKMMVKNPYNVITRNDVYRKMLETELGIELTGMELDEKPNPKQEYIQMDLFKK